MHIRFQTISSCFYRSNEGPHCILWEFGTISAVGNGLRKPGQRGFAVDMRIRDRIEVSRVSGEKVSKFCLDNLNYNKHLQFRGSCNRHVEGKSKIQKEGLKQRHVATTRDQSSLMLVFRSS